MNFGKPIFRVILCAIAVLVMVATARADVYYGGFEDLTGNTDYDYNDLVFTLSGAGLTLHTNTGQWFPKPLINNDGSPFWDRQSFDSPFTTMNVGFCIYGGGCNGNALDPTAQYLATASGGSVGDVYFSTPDGVQSSVTIMITANNSDRVGYCDTVNCYYFGDGSSGLVSSFTFSPVGNFDIWGGNGTQLFDSVVAKDGNLPPGGAPRTWTTDGGVSHFAFFGAVPEPGSIVLLGTILIGAGGLLRRKLSSR